MKREENNNKKNPKKNMKKVIVAYIIGFAILIYFIYAIIQLIKQPTDVFMIEEGKLEESENAVRICYKRRNCCTRK